MLSAEDVAIIKAKITLLERQVGEKHAPDFGQGDLPGGPAREIYNTRSYDNDLRLLDELNAVRSEMASLMQELRAFTLEFETYRKARDVFTPLAQAEHAQPSLVASTSPQAVDAKTISLDQEPEIASIPVPRKRGRPRKTKTEAPPEHSPDAPRKRGRPRKVKDETLIDVPVIPRKRGRPPKAKADSDSVDLPLGPRKRGRPAESAVRFKEPEVAILAAPAPTNRPTRVSWPPKPPALGLPISDIHTPSQPHSGEGVMVPVHSVPRSGGMARLADVLSNPGPSRASSNIGRVATLGYEVGDTDCVSQTSEDVIMNELAYP